MGVDLDVKAIRAELGWTQAQLADHLGVDQSTVSMWETGRLKPRGPARKLLEGLLPSNASEAAE